MGRILAECWGWLWLVVGLGTLIVPFFGQPAFCHHHFVIWVGGGGGGASQSLVRIYGPARSPSGRQNRILGTTLATHNDQISNVILFGYSVRGRLPHGSKFVTQDRSGVISKREINEKMSPMVGGFEWDDADADGQMEFDEFVQTMNTLPPSKHFTCLLWAKTQCPG